MSAKKRSACMLTIIAILCFSQLTTAQDTIYIAKDAGKFVRAWGKRGINVGQLNSPNRLAVGNDGSVYATGNNRVQKFSATGKLLLWWGSAGTGDNQFLGAYGVAVAADGSVLVVDHLGGIPQAGRVKRYTANGKHIQTWGTPGSGVGQFWQPDDIAVDAQGNVIVSDETNQRLQIYSLTGVFKRQWTTADKVPDDIALGPDGTIFHSDTQNHQIVQYNQQGTVLSKWGSSGKGPGMFGTPVGLAVTPGGTLYVADNQFRLVHVFKTDGTFVGTFGSEGTGKGQFKQPKDVAIGKDGSIYVSDNNLYNIQQFKSYVFEPQGKTVTLSGKVTAASISSSDLQKLTVFVTGKDIGGTKRKFTAEVAVGKDGSFTFDGYPIKGKYKIIVKGFKKSDYELSPKRQRGKANSSENDLDFELIKQ